MNNVTALTSGALSKTAFDFEVSHEGELIAYIVAEVLIAVFALFSNLFVLIAIIKFKNLQTSTYWLLASLSVADISVAVLGIPSAIVLRIDKAAVDRATCLVVVSFVIFLTQVSIWSLLLIAVDRFVAIHYHLRYRAIVTSFRVKAGIVGAWLGGAFIGFVPQIGWTTPYNNEDVHGHKIISSEVERCAFEQVTSMEYMVYFNFFGCVLLPLAAMFVLYFMIFRSAKQQLRKIYADVIKLRRRSKLIQKEFRAARSLFTVIGVFALCWLPLHILNCITLFCPECRRPNWLIDLAILLSHANSLVNPIIYAFRLREMKVAFQKLLRSFSNRAKSAF
uniref:G-protein coupled receptors family 1 profile domain-containing protein n=1 Tax=Ciona intestinalis TaxID=7719 RepID=F6Y7X3_CIOIN